MRRSRAGTAPAVYLHLVLLAACAVYQAAAQQQPAASGAGKTDKAAATQAAPKQDPVKVSGTGAQPKRTAAQGGKAATANPRTDGAAIKAQPKAKAIVKPGGGAASNKAAGGQRSGAGKAQGGATEAPMDQPKAAQAANERLKAVQLTADREDDAPQQATAQQMRPKADKAKAKKAVVLTPAEKEKRKAEHKAQAEAHAKQVAKRDAAKEKAAAAVVPQLPAGPKGKEGEALDEAVKAAEKLQIARSTTQEAVLAQDIPTAPAVQLASGDGDVSTTDACRNEVAFFCADVTPGAGRLGLCLSQQARLEADDAADGVHKLSEACKKELDDFNAAIAKNPNANLGLARACKGSIKKLCGTETPGRIIACLRERYNRLPSKCHDAVFGIAVIQADDYRTDPALYAACKADAEQRCPRAHPKQGRVQACLIMHRAALSIQCQEELFRSEVNNADDIRLQSKLFRDCLQDKKKFCADIEPGHSRAIECLEKHREDPGFSPACKVDVDELLAARIKDFRLDPQLKRVCSVDISTTCGVERDLLEKVPDTEASVVTCLQDNREDLIKPACKQRVKHIMELAASDVRFDVPLDNACAEERKTLCAAAQPGHGRIVRCLQTKREQLSSPCKVMLFDHEVRMGESIDFQAPMKWACAAELAQFCSKVPHENVAAIRCLQDKVEDPTFGATCKMEVQKFEQHISKDYRLNRRLEMACRKTIQELCPDACAKPEDAEGCGGTVLNCLVQKVDNITHHPCQREVQYYEKMEVRDIRNDMPLAAACQDDVARYCKDVKSGAGRIHECLREHREQLTSRCAEEEAKLEGAQSANVALQPGLARDCAAEREQHCASVQPGQSRVFNCLIANARQVDFTPKCRGQLMKQQKRRLGDWRLDFNLRTTCEADIAEHCMEESGDEEKTPGAVLHCLTESIGNTHVNCAEETVRAVHAALQFYQPGLPVIKVCDSDARKFCTRQLNPNGKPARIKSIDIPIGHVSDCLLDHLPEDMEDNVGPLSLDVASVVSFDAPNATLASPEQKPSRRLLQGDNVTAPVEPGPVLPEEPLLPNAADQSGSKEKLSSACAALVALGDPKDVYAAYESALGTSLLASQLKKFESGLGLSAGTLVTANKPAQENKAEVLTLTGWSALGAVFALVTLVLLGVVFAIRRCCRGSRYEGYEMVIKKPAAGRVELQ